MTAQELLRKYDATEGPAIAVESFEAEYDIGDPAGALNTMRSRWSDSPLYIVQEMPIDEFRQRYPDARIGVQISPYRAGPV